MGTTTACTTEAEPEVDASADQLNYRSTAGQEYELETKVTFSLSLGVAALPLGEDRNKAILLEAAEARESTTTAITRKLDEIWPEGERVSKSGVSIEFRQKSATLADLKSEGQDRYSMTVSAEFAGITDLVKRLPMKTVAGKTFLAVPDRLGPNPVELQVFISPITRSRNAYPKYLALFEGGLDISVHVGGDHNDPPKDIDHARSIYDDLVRSGFKSPVAAFKDLKLTSGPLTSTIKVKGKDVAVRVRLAHVDMSTPATRNLLIDAYKSAMKTADVVIYDGHAGRSLDFSGVVLAYNPDRAAIPGVAFKDIQVTDKQQVYLFNGCETYGGYADAVYANPKRNTNNTDIITAGNYSAIQPKANQVIAFIHSFIEQESGTWIPRSWDSVLDRMNAVGEESWVHVYGVHGLDDNPKVSPLADMSKVGARCTFDWDCGAPDSRCTSVGTPWNRICGVACADNRGCPAGTECRLAWGDSSPDDRQCLPP